MVTRRMVASRRRRCRSGWASMLALTGLTLLAATLPSIVAGAQAAHYWPGKGGTPLPFADDDEVKDFLLNAEIVERHDIDIGTTEPQRVTLERDGVRVDAVLRCYEHTWPLARLSNGTVYANFTDSFRFEPAAYELARLLGMDNVPPAVLRRLGSRVVTLQLWVYDARMETERAAEGLVPPDTVRWMRQRQQMLLFDALIGNVDRNGGNLLIGSDWKLWLIDHTRAFYGPAPYDGLDGVDWVQRDLWLRLQALDGDSLRAVLGEYLSDLRIDALLRRRDEIVTRVADLIAARGSDAVLYDAGR